MLSPSWLRQLRSRTENLWTRPPARRAPHRRIPHRRLHVEQLEDRTLLSTVLSVDQVSVPGSTGAAVSDTGTWSGAVDHLTSTSGAVVQNMNNTSTRNGTVPGQASPITVYAWDAQNSLVGASEFWLNDGQVFVVTTTLGQDVNGNPVPGSLDQASICADGVTQTSAPTLIAFFASPAPTSPSNGEGERFLGATCVTIDNKGDPWTFSATDVLAITAGDDYVSATATVASSTDPNTAVFGNTSPFSPYLLVVPTTTSVASSVNPSYFGQPVTITATVQPSTADGAALTGKVDLMDTTTGVDLGTVPLTYGSATLITSSLPVGAHSITALYSGASALGNTFALSFLPSSGGLTQQVHYNFSGFVAPLNRTVPAGNLDKQIPMLAGGFAADPAALDGQPAAPSALAPDQVPNANAPAPDADPVRATGESPALAFAPRAQTPASDLALQSAFFEIGANSHASAPIDELGADNWVLGLAVFLSWASYLAAVTNEEPNQQRHRTACVPSARQS